MGRAGSQPVPARLGRVFPVREFRPGIRCDQPIRPGTVRGVCGQAPQTQPPLGHAEGDLRVTGQPRTDHLVWNRHCPQALSALEGNGRTPTVKNVGEPCAGEPHARFDGEGLETEPSVTAPAPHPTRVGLTVWGVDLGFYGLRVRYFMVFGCVCTNYVRPWRWEMLRSSKARRCSGVEVVVMVNAGVSSVGWIWLAQRVARSASRLVKLCTGVIVGAFARRFVQQAAGDLERLGQIHRRW